MQGLNTTFVSTISCIQERGFYGEFVLINQCIESTELQIIIDYEDVHVLEMHYFPADGMKRREGMIYAINVPLYCMKGILVISGATDNIAFLSRRKGAAPMLKHKNNTELKINTVLL